MPRLLPYVRPFVERTPSIYAADYTQTVSVGPYTLPLSGSAVFEYVHSLQKPLKSGYIAHIATTVLTTGSWFGKTWRGDFDCRDANQICPDASRPECLVIQDFLQLGPGLANFGGGAIRIFGSGQNQVKFRFQFSYASHSGTAPHNVNVNIVIVVYKPSVFVNWVP